jgi:adenylate kinase
MINIVLFGPPGAGKGTQSDKIIEKYNLTHVSTGELFRKHLSEGTPLGTIVKKYMDDGNLVPDEVVIKMVELVIEACIDCPGVIFDGFPRTVNQAIALDVMLQNYGKKISGMILLEVDENELKKRIMLRGKTSGRTDDQDLDKINTRIQVYKSETYPVADYYKSQSKLNIVKGVGTIDEIFTDLCKVVDRLPG